METQKVQKKVYVFRVKKRYEYAKQFNVKRKAEEREPNRIAAFLRPLLDRFAKK